MLGDSIANSFRKDLHNDEGVVIAVYVLAFEPDDWVGRTCIEHHIPVVQRSSTFNQDSDGIETIRVVPKYQHSSLIKTASGFSRLEPRQW